MTSERGVFTLSLDTELAWGTFDIDRVEQHADAYRRTPVIIDELCELFDEYAIPATWAVVSHLLIDCGGDHAGRTSPKFEWTDDWFNKSPCSGGLEEELWYIPWLVDRLQSVKTKQEIGLHGATHMPLGADGCSRQNAEEELETAVETLHSHGVEPKSFVFPRNKIGHIDILAKYGIRVFRGVNARWYERKSVNAAKPLLRFADEATRRTPPIVEPKVHNGIVEIPGSQMFRPTQGGWQYTPGESNVARAKKGLQRAARTGGVFHLWFHPFNLAHNPEKDLQSFERVLAAATELVEEGVLKCRPMQEIGELARQGKWD